MLTIALLIVSSIGNLAQPVVQTDRRRPTSRLAGQPATFPTVSNHKSIKTHQQQRMERKSSSATITVTDAPLPPLRLNLKQKSIWATITDTVSPSEVIEKICSEKAKIMEQIDKRGYIMPEEAEFLNHLIKTRAEKILEDFKQEAIKQTLINPSDGLEQIKFKVDFSDQLLSWLSSLFVWLTKKITTIFDKLQEGIDWCIQKAKELFEYLWSLFT